MKKILLAFATVLLVTSCDNEVLIDETQNTENEVQAPIHFTTFTDKATRAASTNLEDYHETFAVYGVKSNNGLQTVFGADAAAGTTITYNAGAAAPNDWTYAPYRYWDKQATYEFIAYAPASAPLVYNFNASAITGGKFTTSAAYTLVGQNIQNGTSAVELYEGFDGLSGNDADIMTAAMQTADGATYPHTDVNLTFSHILSKLNIAVKQSTGFAADIKVKDIAITGLDDQGTYDATVWTSSVDDAAYQLHFAGDVEIQDDKLYFIESLVMPQTMKGQLTMEYTITTGSYTETYYYTVAVADIFGATVTDYDEGKNYTITFTIAPEVITFDAGVAAWADGANGTQTID